MDVRVTDYPACLSDFKIDAQGYRVVFWAHQHPPPGVTAHEMGWAELSIDVSEASDVHEVIRWAEEYVVEFAQEHPGTEHLYCLYSVIPSVPPDGNRRLVLLAGTDPTLGDIVTISATFIERPKP